MTAVLDATTIKLTTATNGDIWALWGEDLPRPTGYNLQRLPGDWKPGETESWRVPAAQKNVPLIVHLGQHVAAGRGRSLEVCSPRCSTQEQPAEELYSARAFNHPASAGGWHRYADADALIYYMTVAYQKRSQISANPPYAPLQCHPMWHALSFISGLHFDYVGVLVSLILDPRWFVDPEHPDRDNRLPQYLGLDPTTQAMVASGPPDPQSATRSAMRARRYNIVRRAWGAGKMPTGAALADPGNFVWRAYLGKGGLKGEIAASKLFVAFLSQVWLASITPYAELFVPEYFFRKGEEAAAYKKHLQAAC